ncbi:dihydrofolate reductase family protein [Tunturibacter empetritectus]|uniref:Dihydrofolate reductase n=1 Tax=Tunturiibacter lichenicola TaxID=2051959 RepID=A0A7W8J6U3_9BACT|nr:dihydrofolate reductase family protein [Edaphobacter lichenicola]MBB5342636.1 dihydrofolate reductase [Edaphobacter lichenicola]
MRRVMVFNMISLDGYIADANGDMSWARQQDKEWNEFTQGNAKGDSLMLFGRKTYDLMAGFWPTSTATAMMPEVAERMNSAKKAVFSRSMEMAGWKNTTLVKGDPGLYFLDQYNLGFFAQNPVYGVYDGQTIADPIPKKLQRG